MQKSFSAAQRDKILMSEYKNDIKNRKDLLEVIREGNTAFQTAADKISDAMTKMSDAFGTIAKCFASLQPNQNQGMAYHQPPPHHNPKYWRPQPG